MGLLVLISVGALALLGIGIGLWLALRGSRGRGESVDAAVDVMTESAREVGEVTRRSKVSEPEED